MDVILNTCVSTINELTTLILSELERTCIKLMQDILMIYFCQVGKNSCLRSGLN